MWAAIGTRFAGLLGGKGANLADMTRIGVPVPPWFHGHHGSLQCLPGRRGKFPEGMWDQMLTDS